MLNSELVSRVRRGEEVVLRESAQAFLLRTLGPVLAVLISGVVLGLMKGGLWWGIAGFGGGAFVFVLLWVPIRQVPQVTISAEAVVFKGDRFEWNAIESFGAASDEYTPDWIYVTTSEGDRVSLGSTFGWKKELLRDALNDLLKEYHTGSARAQFEACREDAADAPDDESTLRFRRPTGPEDALQQARALLSSYYHVDCDTVTEVSDRVIRIAAFDPHYFPLHETECSGCGSASMKDVTLTNGQSLYEVFSAMQKLTPLKAQLGKFFLFSAILAPAGAIAGLCVPVPQNGWLLGCLGGGAGLLIGIIISLLMYRPLRKAGYLW